MVQFPTITFIINTLTPVNPQKREIIIQKIGNIVYIVGLRFSFQKNILVLLFRELQLNKWGMFRGGYFKNKSINLVFFDQLSVADIITCLQAFFR